MLSHPLHLFSLGFGSGLSPVMPGTMGTLLAWASFAALDARLTVLEWAVLIAGGFVAGIYVTGFTARKLGIDDPSAIVWDEIVAFWIVLWLVMPVGFWGQLAAFLLFRAFDAAKPGPVAWADALFKPRRGQPIGWAQGFGIIFDDLVAALCALLVIALWRFL